MRAMKTGTSSFQQNKSVSIAALIICFIIACGIWLYAQATDDDIKVTVYNQIPVEFVGGDSFKETTGYDVHSLLVQNANVTISGTNRELVKYDAQNIRLIADVGAANNGVATIKAYHVDEDGNKTEIKNYEITPAVVTVNVAKSVEYTVTDITADKNELEYLYKIEETSLSGTFTVIGPVQDVDAIGSVKFDLDYKNVMNTPGTHTVPVTSIVFLNHEGEPLYSETNKNENIKYDTTGIMVSVTVESIHAETNDK